MPVGERRRRPAGDPAEFQATPERVAALAALLKGVVRRMREAA
ncbi:hypothetical protein [Streptomyces sp. MH60]|nr:hypothetical protein [Streptomyces sp. MH60]